MEGPSAWLAKDKVCTLSIFISTNTQQSAWLDFNGFYMECLFAERSQKVASHMPAPWGPQHQHPELLSLHSKALRALYLPQLKEGCGGPVGAVGKWVQSF